MAWDDIPVSSLKMFAESSIVREDALFASIVAVDRVSGSRYALVSLVIIASPEPEVV